METVIIKTDRYMSYTLFRHWIPYVGIVMDFYRDFLQYRRVKWFFDQMLPCVFWNIGSGLLCPYMFPIENFTHDVKCELFVSYGVWSHVEAPIRSAHYVTIVFFSTSCTRWLVIFTCPLLHGQPSCFTAKSTSKVTNVVDQRTLLVRQGFMDMQCLPDIRDTLNLQQVSLAWQAANTHSVRM